VTVQVPNLHSWTFLFAMAAYLGFTRFIAYRLWKKTVWRDQAVAFVGAGLFTVCKARRVSRVWFVSRSGGSMVQTVLNGLAVIPNDKRLVK
jgi:hypothetical protein